MIFAQGILMFTVIGCITRNHDPGMVALACVVCVLAATTSTRLLAAPRARSTGLRRTRITAAIAALAIGLWTTHFIGLLAFRRDLPSDFAIPFCLLSLALAVVAASAVILIATQCRRSSAAILLGGLLFAGLVTLMHFAGMRSLLLPGIVRYDNALIGIGALLGTACATAAMASLMPRPQPVRFWSIRSQSLASVFLASTVLTVHFTAMAAITFDFSAGIDVTAGSVPKPILAIAAATGGLLIVLLALCGSMLDQHFAARIATEARRLHLLADATFEGLIFERAGRIIDTNRAMCTLTGQEQQTLIGAPLNSVIKGITLRSTPGQPTEHELVRPDGTVRAVEVLWKNGPDPGGHVVAVRDITREKAAQIQLQKLVQFDALTGLVNRDHFELLLQKALAQTDRSAGLALHYLDLDRFQSVYESFGARASDQALVQTARRLSRIVRPSDVVARIGHDEFAIMQPLGDRGSDAATLAERTMAEMAMPFDADGQTIPLTASVGVALYPADGTSAESLLKNAAMAMRQAKRQGRATLRYFEPEVDQRRSDMRNMEQELRKALADGEFAVHYQTFYCSETMEVGGAEALLRWNHPTRGRVSPADFIPVAEENGMIVPIGNWVLQTACAEAASWDKPVVIAVNLSPAQFTHQSIVGDVRDVLRQTGLAPERLELEITEGILMADTEYALRILSALKALGVKIAMDDFGTGYSSLSYLRKFHFDKIKIDRSFISDVDDDTEAESIVEAIIKMGQSLRLEITAEGVETDRQRVMLRNKGCTFIQGFLLAKPCQADQLDLSPRVRYLHTVGSGSALPRLTAVPAIAQSV